MFASHLYVFFGEMSVYFFGPFFDSVIYFSGIELQELLTHQSGWLPSKSLQAINAGEDVEKREPSYTVGGNEN